MSNKRVYTNNCAITSCDEDLRLKISKVVTDAFAFKYNLPFCNTKENVIDLVNQLKRGTETWQLFVDTDEHTILYSDDFNHTRMYMLFYKSYKDNAYLSSTSTDDLLSELIHRGYNICVSN